MVIDLDPSSASAPDLGGTSRESQWLVRTRRGISRQRSGDLEIGGHITYFRNRGTYHPFPNSPLPWISTRLQDNYMLRGERRDDSGRPGSKAR